MSRQFDIKQNQPPGEQAMAILGTILYFDVFRHPLTLDEIFRYVQWHHRSLSEVAAAIEELQSAGILECEDGFYFFAGTESTVRLRRERNKRALLYGEKAERWSKFISGFPFIRTVCISGSLSKGTMDKDGDIDYFIITEPGRLWLARTMLILFKKVFLFNSRKYFCVNYFIDTDHLAIPDRNLFTATELATVKPMRDSDIFESFLKENHWAELFYPNAMRHPSRALPARNGAVKRTAERLFNGKPGEWLDNFFFRLTLRRWKRKFPHHRDTHFEVDFRSRKYVSKHHPQGFQRSVMARMEQRREELNRKYGIVIQSPVFEWISPTVMED